MKKKNLNTLQIFRGIAALMVVFFHATGTFLQDFNQMYLFGIFDQGFSGVDFFFILSGFIIFYVHKSDIGKRNKFKEFITKRFIRVYPIHWVATSLMFLAFIATGFGESLVSNFKVIISSYLLTPSPEYINGVIWTLSHEVLFYLLFSTLIIFDKRLSFTLLSSWLLISLLNFTNAINFDSFLMNFLFSKFNIEFALGALSAYLVVNYKLIYRKTILAIGLILTLASWTFLHLGVFNIDRVLAFGIPFTLVIIGAASVAYRGEIKTPKVLKYIGDASYSIYLIHLLFLNMFTKIVDIMNVPELIGYSLSMNLIVVLTVGMSCGFYQLCEKPLINILNKKIRHKKAEKLNVRTV